MPLISSSKNIWRAKPENKVIFQPTSHRLLVLVSSDVSRMLSKRAARLEKSVQKSDFNCCPPQSSSFCRFPHTRWPPSDLGNEDWANATWVIQSAHSSLSADETFFFFFFFNFVCSWHWANHSATLPQQGSSHHKKVLVGISGWYPGDYISSPGQGIWRNPRKTVDSIVVVFHACDMCWVDLVEHSKQQDTPYKDGKGFPKMRHLCTCDILWHSQAVWCPPLLGYQWLVAIGPFHLCGSGSLHLCPRYSPPGLQLQWRSYAFWGRHAP